MAAQAQKKEGEGEAPPPGRFAKLKPVLLAVVLLGAGAGAGFGGSMFLGGGETAEAAPAEEHVEGEPKAETAAGHGEPADDGHGAKKEEGGGHGEAEGGGHGEAKKGGGHGEAKKAEDHGSTSVGVMLNRRGRAVVTLGVFTVNLRGSGGGRILRSEVQVEVDARDESVVVEERPALRDAVITLGSDYTYADLEGIDGKTHLRDEINARVANLLEGRANVHRIYFTEFVVQ
jgi:flagellar basal body-associated protein FliL